MSIILVCGGRDYTDAQHLAFSLDALRAQPDFEITMVVEGGANGADTLARQWAESRGIHCAEVKALWGFHGKRAGYLRNDAMLILKPVYCVAFPGGKGTDMMVRLCAGAAITVWRVGR